MDRASFADVFHDLNVDQVVRSIIAGLEEYALEPYFNAPLHSVDEVVFRQQVFRDVELTPVRAVLETFAEAMSQVRRLVAAVGKLHYRHHQERWFLDAANLYCATVTRLCSELPETGLASRGLTTLMDHATTYIESAAFIALRDETRTLLSELGEVRYDVLVRGAKITVGPYDGELDYSQQVLATFARFQQGDVKDYHSRLPEPSMNHVEAAVLDLVASLHQPLFDRIAAFWMEHQAFLDATIGRFDRELQFYLAYLRYLAPLRTVGLATCYPTVSRESKVLRAEATYDLALAAKLTAAGESTITNEVYLEGPERILVVSGPNQGGKTTLARTIGQLIYLAGLGCPVPGASASLFLPDRIFTHFEREEDLETLAGKLEEELQRIHGILADATINSVVILNEMFSSTTVQDALALSRAVLGQISDLDALCVCVSFIDELSRMNDKTVSMVSTVQADDPAVRTFRLVRMPADGRAYALAIAEKYGLTSERLKMRIGS